MRPPWQRSGTILLTVALAALGLVAAGILLTEPVRQVLEVPATSGAYDAERLVLLYSTLPRLVMALLCGAGLGASGAILQQVLRNPIASPTTLGIDAGARLALAAAGFFMPGLLGLGRDLMALAGSAASTLAVFAIVRRRGMSAFSIVLAGLVVSLYCGALSSVLVLAGDRYLASLFIWGSGSLSQQSWAPSLALAWRLAACGFVLMILLRPLALLDAGEQSAASLGVPVPALRTIAVTIAAAMSAFVTSAVGVIGFVGLVAPILARLSGAQSFASRLAFSSVLGALLLFLTDAAVQNLASGSINLVPTGAVTAVLASPLLLMLLPGLRPRVRPPTVLVSGDAGVRPFVIAGAVFVALLVVVFSIGIGRDPDGAWRFASASDWNVVLQWRGPRLAAASFGGALLSVSGVILQRMTGNELASPEMLGVSAGSILAVALGLFAFPEFGGPETRAAAVCGALGVLGLILFFSRRSGFAPEKVLIAGIALNALIDAIVGVLTATGDPRALALLGWMSGSTSRTTAAEAWQVAIATLILIPVSLLTVRWLDILPLGGSRARALGMPLSRVRLGLLLLAAVFTALATLIVGPLSFVGLLAPHLAGQLGARRALPTVLVASVSGALIMACADTLGRTAAFPLQIPTGLMAAIVGTPILMFLLCRRRIRV